jgi:hypothetical protein
MRIMSPGGKVAKRIAFAVAIEALAMFSVGAQTSPHGNIQILCQSCHTTDSWSMMPDASFKHEQTGFVLEGQHKSLECVRCHTGLKFVGASERCASCHTDIHKAELGSNCARCHTVQSWKIPDMLQRHQSTRFPLVGKHVTLNCQDCHTGVASNQYLGTPVTCIGCHRSDYTATTNPNHTSAGLSTSCMDCHSGTALSWNASFNHDLTPFPLTGAHRAIACQSCHQSGSFRSTPTACYACHQTQFTSTTSPNHVLGGFATTCQLCHSTTAWQPATFDHTTTRFPLTGAHQSTPCLSCHTNNNYQLAYTGCYSCHTANYASTTDPNHASVGFPTTCETCHSTTTWAGATFNHTWFPTSHGSAGGVCSTCHTNSSNYAVFQCTTCHTQSQTDSHHSDVRGYVWNSANCYACHPSGRSG